jgi:hypothetical protein
MRRQGFTAEEGDSGFGRSQFLGETVYSVVN